MDDRSLEIPGGLLGKMLSSRRASSKSDRLQPRSPAPNGLSPFHKRFACGLFRALGAPSELDIEVKRNAVGLTDCDRNT